MQQDIAYGINVGHKYSNDPKFKAKTLFLKFRNIVAGDLVSQLVVIF